MAIVVPELIPELIVYFDGLCQLCSREIDHYRRQTGSEKLRFMDITDPSFDAAAEGLDLRRVHQVMHVKTANGELRTGVDAFIAIWETLPRYQGAARWARRSLVKKVLEFGYVAFAQARPYLPRKKQDCSSSPYCQTRRT